MFLLKKEGIWTEIKHLRACKSLVVHSHENETLEGFHFWQNPSREKEVNIKTQGRKNCITWG